MALPDRIEDWRKLAVGIGGLVAVYMYGVAYFTLDNYYAVFGLSPEDAGVTQTTLVATALTGFGIFAGLVAVAVLAGWAVKSKLEQVAKRPWWHAVGGGMAGAVAVVVGVLALRGLTAFALVLLGAGIGCILGAAVADTDRPLQAPAHRSAHVAGIAVVVGVAVAFLICVEGAGEQMARKVVRDGDLRRASLWEEFASISLGIHANHVYGDAEVGCATAIAWHGDHVWVVKADAGNVARVVRFDRTKAEVRYAIGTSPSTTAPATPNPRDCWHTP